MATPMSRRRPTGRGHARPRPTGSATKPAKHGFNLGIGKKASKPKPVKTTKKSGSGKKKFSLLGSNKNQTRDQRAEEEALKRQAARVKAENKKLVDTTQVVHDQLKGPAKLIGDNELALLVKMDTKVSSIQKRMSNRFMIFIFCVLLGLFAGFINKNQFGLMAGAGAVLAGFTWYMDIKKTSDYYRQFQLKRQIAFSQFTRLAAAYLPELKQGTNLYAIFERIVPRMEDPRDAAALQKLMIDMQLDPDDSGPFLEFAHAFSVSNRAELIMLVIQDMYRGNVDDSNIRSLADDANNDMLNQSQTVIDYKLHKFDSLTTKVGVAAMIPIIGFFTDLVITTIGGALGSVKGIQH